MPKNSEQPQICYHCRKPIPDPDASITLTFCTSACFQRREFHQEKTIIARFLREMKKLGRDNPTKRLKG